MNDINKMPPKCQYCPYWEVCKYPWVCPDIGDKKPKRTEKRTETHASDCISRQALCEYALNQKDKNITANDIMRFPSAQRWIPCSERLPDRFGKMLVTFIPGTLWTYVIIANYSDLMGIAKPCFWIGNVGKSDFANITSRVVAWMPLPEPYKGG